MHVARAILGVETTSGSVGTSSVLISPNLAGHLHTSKYVCNRTYAPRDPRKFTLRAIMGNGRLLVLSRPLVQGRETEDGRGCLGSGFDLNGSLDSEK